MKAIVLALLAVGFCIAAPPAHAADSRNVNVINETGYAIKMLGFNAPDDGLDGRCGSPARMAATTNW